MRRQNGSANVEGMNSTLDSPTPPTPDASPVPRTSPARQPLPWLLIVGLSSLALLWPLTALWGIGQGPLRALAILGLTAAVWIGVVGGARIQSPVLTLTIVGLLHGLLTRLLGGVLAGSGGSVGDPAALWTLLPSLAGSAGVGAVMGLVALGVQKALGPRTGPSAARRGES